MTENLAPLITPVPRAPMAYLLLASAVVIYLATILMRQVDQPYVPERFSDATVWSDFEAGYGLVPAVLLTLT